MAYPPVVTDVITAAQVLLTETLSEAFDSTTLLPFAVQANRQLADYLVGHDATYFRTEASPITVAISTTPTTISRGGGTGFPTDLIRPVELRERPLGGAVGTYTSMMDNGASFFSDATSTDAQRCNSWRWVKGVIQVGPSTTAREVQIMYDARVDVAAGADALPVPGSLQAVTFWTVMLALASRDEPTLAGFYKTLGEESANLLLGAESLKPLRPRIGTKG